MASAKPSDSPQRSPPKLSSNSPPTSPPKLVSIRTPSSSPSATSVHIVDSPFGAVAPQPLVVPKDSPKKSFTKLINAIPIAQLKRPASSTIDLTETPIKREHVIIEDEGEERVEEEIKIEDPEDMALRSAFASSTRQIAGMVGTTADALIVEEGADKATPRDDYLAAQTEALDTFRIMTGHSELTYEDIARDTSPQIAALYRNLVSSLMRYNRILSGKTYTPNKVLVETKNRIYWISSSLKFFDYRNGRFVRKETSLYPSSSFF